MCVSLFAAAVGVKRGALAAVQYEMHTFQIEKEGGPGGIARLSALMRVLSEGLGPIFGRKWTALFTII